MHTWLFQRQSSLWWIVIWCILHCTSRNLAIGVSDVIAIKHLLLFPLIVKTFVRTFVSREKLMVVESAHWWPCQYKLADNLNLFPDLSSRFPGATLLFTKVNFLGINGIPPDGFGNTLKVNMEYQLCTAQVCIIKLCFAQTCITQVVCTKQLCTKQVSITQVQYICSKQYAVYYYAVHFYAAHKYEVHNYSLHGYGPYLYFHILVNTYLGKGFFIISHPPWLNWYLQNLHLFLSRHLVL